MGVSRILVAFFLFQAVKFILKWWYLRDLKVVLYYSASLYSWRLSFEPSFLTLDSYASHIQSDPCIESVHFQYLNIHIISYFRGAVFHFIFKCGNLVSWLSKFCFQFFSDFFEWKLDQPIILFIASTGLNSIPFESDQFLFNPAVYTPVFTNIAMDNRSTTILDANKPGKNILYFSARQCYQGSLYYPFGANQTIQTIQS